MGKYKLAIKFLKRAKDFRKPVLKTAKIVGGVATSLAVGGDLLSLSDRFKKKKYLIHTDPAFKKKHKAHKAKVSRVLKHERKYAKKHSRDSDYSHFLNSPRWKKEWLLKKHGKKK